MECPTPRFYLDLPAARASAEQGETPWTPGLSLLYGLEAALKLIETEGFDAVVQRHTVLAGRLRQGLADLGFQILAAPGFASPTVTAAFLPTGVDARRLISLLEDEFSIQIAGGQGELKGKIIRIGHMGYITEENVRYLLTAIAAALVRLREEAQ